MTAPIAEGGGLHRGTDSRRIIVLDTDPGVRWALEQALTRSGYAVHAVATLSHALRLAHEHPIGAILLEILPEAGLTFDTLTTLVQCPNSPRVICVSIDSSPQTVVECLRRGAADFLLKPFSLAEVRGVISRSLERGPLDARGPEKPFPPDGPLLIGVSPAMQELRRLVQQAARTDLNCLIRGESGVGKDIVAREIHRLSKRHEKPFIKVNCSALPENLLESELFGYEKGAFTGADTSKPGRFTLANEGIIFLDEIGDMHPYVQAKILQVIEHKEFTKLGGGAPVKVDVQIIAATNADLERKIAAGAFRDDLYFRLNEVYIWVPPLKDRPEDVPVLIHHFLKKHGHYSPDGEPSISKRDLDALTHYDWPGNVRELESTIKRWLALGQNTPLRPPKPTDGATRKAAPRAPAQGAAAPPAEVPPPERILEVLDANQWNRRKAAALLGMSYSALRRAIDKHALDKRRR